MTTTVTVTTHDWPAKVLGFAKQDGDPAPDAQWEEIATVAPNSSRAFHPHAGLDILIQIQELPKPE